MTESAKQHETTAVQQEDWFGFKKIYKAVIEYTSMGDTLRITLYTLAPGFETARIVFSNTAYIKDKHGHLVGMTEVKGVFIE